MPESPGRAVKVAITGASGFIGWHLAERFRDAGWDVTAVVRQGRQKALPEEVTPIESPLDAATLTRATAGASLIVHAAGLTHAPDESAFQAVNAAGTEAIVQAANENDARLVYVSTQAVAGVGTLERPSREEDEPRPLTAYGRSKLAGESIVRERAAVPWTIVRPSSVYGPRDRQFLPLFRMAARGLFPLAAAATMPVTLIYIDDLARAIALASTAPGAIRETLFLGHPETVTPDMLLRAFAEVFERRYRPWRVPRPILEGLAWSGELSWKLGRAPLVDQARLTELTAEGFVCAVDRARELLGFTAAVGLAEGVARTAQWYRSQGWV